MVVVANGVYGDRIAAMAAAARLHHTVVQSAWTLPPDLEHLEQAIREPDVEAVAAPSHHETTPVSGTPWKGRPHGLGRTASS